MILDLAELFQISQHEASLALQAGQFEYETAVEHVVKMRELEAKKKQKHAKETPLKDAKVHKEQKEQKELKEPMEQR